MKIYKIAFPFLFTLYLFSGCSEKAKNDDERGIYFSKKEYAGKEIPLFNESKHLLPQPVLTENAEWLEMYWKCWEIAFQHFKKPPANSPFVSNILDEAFNENIFQWDMIFMIMFARYGHDIFPAVNSLDNFYCRQHASGYICREISEKDGSDFVYIGREHTINPPLFSWAEIESFKNTGDMSRFEMILPVLEKYVEWLNKEGDLKSANNSDNWNNSGRCATNSVHQLYWNTGLGSGMDNTPRGGNGWVDMSCQMVIQYRNLALMSKMIGKDEKESYFNNEAKKITDRINKYCWSEEDGLYYDVDSTGNQIKWKTSGCFWPMLAGIASKEQCERLVKHLQDTASFWRKNVFPTLAADQSLYNPEGGYWLGSIWAPTNYAIIKGLEQNGFEELARKATEKYLEQMFCVFDSTKTVWENYSPDYCAPGNQSKPDFVGWTGVGPIALLIENVLGFRVNAAENTLTWHITRTDRHGITNLKIGKVAVSAICEKSEQTESSRKISFSTTGKIKLEIFYYGQIRHYELEEGEHNIVLK